MSTEMTPVVEMKNISMQFKGTKALDNVNLKLYRGEVLGLIGENGAGKSTLMKVLCGVYPHYEGEIYLNGSFVKIHNTSHSQKLGITMIYQELSLFLDLNAVENIFINQEISNYNFLFDKINKKKMKEKAKEIITNQLFVNIDLDKPTRELRLADRQLIEIARSLSTNAEVIIMDEPTEALEIAEQEQLFRIIKELKRQGKAIIYISHQIDQLLEISDRIDILRDGKNVCMMNSHETTVKNIIDLMIGSQVNNQYPSKNKISDDVILRIKNLSKKKSFDNISFDLHRGEIIGLAGLAGSGKSEFIRSLFGAVKYDDGEILIDEKYVEISNTRKAINNKIAFLSADRQTEGLFLDQDIEWNTSIAALKKLSKISIQKKTANTKTREYVKELSIKANSINQEISALSGGNKQKVLIARWLLMSPDIILMEEPTRGIDINAKSEIYRLLSEIVKNGKAIIIMSSESPELLGLCNRILVFHNGKISASLNGDKTSEKEIAYYTVQDTKGETYYD